MSNSSDKQGQKSDIVPDSKTKPDAALTGIRILLVVSGSIAVFKSCQLARNLISAGAELRILMTDSATSFVRPLTFEYISHQPVLLNRFDGQDGSLIDHIALARWPQLVVIAPISANRISRLALGLADDLLGACLLAADTPVIIAPAMNQQMWAQSVVQQHIESLTQRGWHLAAPGWGEQACGEVGPGRMMEVEELQSFITKFCHAGLAAQVQSAGTIPATGVANKGGRVLRCLMTMGATIEDIDPVRFISNRSSGKMGLALFESLGVHGVETRAICANISHEVSWRRKNLGAENSFIDVRTTQEMLDASFAAAREFKPDLFIGVAAVCDYRPVKPSQDKMSSSEPSLKLEFEANPDIIAAIKREFPQIYCVAFAAESGDMRTRAAAKLDAKGVDMIVANSVAANSDKFDSLESDDIQCIILSRNFERDLGRLAKASLSVWLVEEILEQIRSRQSPDAPDQGANARLRLNRAKS